MDNQMPMPTREEILAAIEEGVYRAFRDPMPLHEEILIEIFDAAKLAMADHVKARRSR